MLLIATIFTLSLPSIIGEDKWLSEDKFEHIFISSFLVTSIYSISHYELQKTPKVARQVAIGISLSSGLIKELYDLTGRGNPSVKDITANILGILIGLFLFSS